MYFAQWLLEEKEAISTPVLAGALTCGYLIHELAVSV